jgi:large subunit ribosomal protein L19
VNAEYRCLSSVSTPEKLVSEETKEEKTDGHKTVVPLECRFVYPEFLPDPRVERRNSLREKLERIDMLNRRSNIDIPEFYTGEP